MPPVTTELLAGDADRALDQLLASWRAGPRSAQLAELIERVSARIEGALPPLGMRDGRVLALEPFQVRWLAVAAARRAVDLPRLVASLVETMQRSGTAIVDAFGERVAALVAWPDDPRLGAQVAKLLGTNGIFGPTGKTTQPAWTRLFDRVIANADPRDGARFARFDFKRMWRGWNDVATRIAFLTAQCARVREALSEDPPKQRASLAAIDKALKRTRSIGDAAEARILVEPEPRRAAPTKPSRARAVDDRDTELRELVHAWRAARDPRIATLIDERTARATLGTTSLATGGKREDLQRTWLALVERGDPLDLPRLLEGITDTHHRATDALARAKALHERYAGSPDPRIASGILAQLTCITFHSSSTHPFWTAMFALAVEHGDLGTAAALEDLATRFPAILAERYADRATEAKWFAARARRAAQELRAAPAVEHATALAPAIAKIATQLAATRAKTQRLEDAGERSVLADHLLGEGDPRGELIALELANRDPKRQEEILAEHLARWLGPLAECAWLDGVILRDGVVDRFPFSRASADAIARVRGLPMLSQARAVGLPYDLAFPTELLAALPKLEHLGLRDEEHIAALARNPMRTLRSVGLDFGLAAADWRTLLAAVPKLETFELGHPWFEDPAAAEPGLRGAKHLKLVRLEAGCDLAAWIPRLARLRVALDYGTWERTGSWVSVRRGKATAHLGVDRAGSARAAKDLVAIRALL